MRIKNCSTALMATAVALLGSCAKPVGTSSVTEHELENDPVSIKEQHLKAAKTLDKQGRHLEASVYYEAAIDGGNCEREILPLLISSQVRAGRLEAAKQNIARLGQIAPKYRGINELEELITNLTRSTHERGEGGTR